MVLLTVLTTSTVSPIQYAKSLISLSTDDEANDVQMSRKLLRLSNDSL